MILLCSRDYPEFGGRIAMQNLKLEFLLLKAFC